MALRDPHACLQRYARNPGERGQLPKAAGSQLSALLLVLLRAVLFYFLRASVSVLHRSGPIAILCLPITILILAKVLTLERVKFRKQVASATNGLILSCSCRSYTETVAFSSSEPL